MRQPLLTIDFIGLHAFVADQENLDNATKVDVLMMEADETASGLDLCRHEPLLIFSGSAKPKASAFSAAGEDTKHVSFFDTRTRDIGIWPLRGKEIRLAGADPETTVPLHIRNSFQEILSSDQLAPGKGAVDEEWLGHFADPEVSARVRIESGIISAHRWSSFWHLSPLPTPPSAGTPTRFRQIVQWSIYAQPQDLRLRLEASVDEWIEFRPGAHVTISNLCPLSPGGSEPSEDVLAYYTLLKERIPPEERLVLHPASTGSPNPAPKPNSSTKYQDTRPAMDACPPLRAFLS